MKLIHAPFYQNYVNLVGDSDLYVSFTEQTDTIQGFLQSIPQEKWLYSYQEGKWSVAQVVRHCLDTERIMAFRALSIARGEGISLPGFSENDYAQESSKSQLSSQDLCEEFYFLRKSNLYLINSLTEELMDRQGIADGQLVTVASLWYIIVGHWIHHINILNERYF